ncbi:unnamed protein product, partial [Effrenium voratum]
ASPRPRRPPRPSPPRQGLQLRRPQPPQRQQGPPLPQWVRPRWQTAPRKGPSHRRPAGTLLCYLCWRPTS